MSAAAKMQAAGAAVTAAAAPPVADVNGTQTAASLMTAGSSAGSRSVRSQIAMAAYCQMILHAAPTVIIALGSPAGTALPSPSSYASAWPNHPLERGPRKMQRLEPG